jgi:hypothetical protein
MIDRHVLRAIMRARRELELAVGDIHLHVGRNDVNLPALDGHGVLNLHDRNVRRGGEQVGEKAVMTGREMLNHDDGEFHFARQRVQQLRAGFQPAGAGANPDDMKW